MKYFIAQQPDGKFAILLQTHREIRSLQAHEGSKGTIDIESREIAESQLKEIRMQTKARLQTQKSVMESQINSLTDQIGTTEAKENDV